MWKHWRWIVLVVLLVLATAIVVDAQGGITVLQDDYSYAFNKELVFDLALQSNEPIPAKSVELLYSVGRDGDVVNRRRPEYEPDKTLTLRVRDELGQGEIPPTSTITYHWKITDAAGGTFETGEQSFVYMDDRFNWQSKTEGPITLYWYGRVDGEQLLNVAMDALSRLEKTVGYQMRMPINLVAYSSKRDMDGAMAPRGQTFDEQIVTLGTVVAPDVMLLLSDSDVDNTIAHELTHMVVGAATDNPFAEIPAWLNEGLAMYNQDFVGRAHHNALDDAVRGGDLDTVRRLSARTGNVARVNLWYAEVWSLVDFLINEYGQEKMAELLDVFSRGAHPDDALMEVYGFDRDGLTARWWEWLGAEVPPSLRGEPTTAPAPGREEGATGGGQTQVPEVREAPTRAPAVPKSEPARQPAPQPTGPLACCLGLLPLGLILFGGLRFRNCSSVISGSGG
ncbi:MAG: peptidase MA family metallohydrolase [Anaerolineae bacterium]